MLVGLCRDHENPGHHVDDYYVIPCDRGGGDTSALQPRDRDHEVTDLTMSSSDELLQSLDDPDADIILRSCDHHEFRVLKLYLTKVSPLLRAREQIQFASNSHIANTTSFLPSIQLSDSATTLSSLLTFILPMLPVLPSTLEHIIILLSAAQTYQMNPILSRIRTMIASLDLPFICPETAFQVYSLARMHGLHQETLQAARMTLTFPFTLDNLGDKLDAIPGIYLHELWKYYQSVRIHLATDLAAFRATSIPVLTSLPCFPITTYHSPAWLDDYIKSIADSPALFDLTEFHMCLSRHIRQYRCLCADIPSETLRALWTDLTNVVHSCMKKVGFNGLRYCEILSNNWNVSLGRISYSAIRRLSTFRESCLPTERLTGFTA